MSRNVVISSLVILLVLALGIFVYAKSRSINTQNAGQTATIAPIPSPTIMPSPSNASSSAVASSSASLEAAASITLTGSNYKFTPSTITVKKGDTVKITFTSSGGMHDFVLNDFNVATKILSAGESQTVSFVANKTGTFEYYCSVDHHRQMGMVGKLIVE